ncbi:hypothetical protein TRVL_10205 [Trypanosoma vivax]|nr:hypothetical protein TRVL_10205 [Trypanosoma vivax]
MRRSIFRIVKGVCFTWNASFTVYKRCLGVIERCHRPDLCCCVELICASSCLNIRPPGDMPFCGLYQWPEPQQRHGTASEHARAGEALFHDHARNAHRKRVDVNNSVIEAPASLMNCARTRCGACILWRAWNS